MHKFDSSILQPTLSGPTLTLRPLSHSDWEKLYAVASNPEIWAQHPNTAMYTETEFKKYFESGINSNSAFAIIDKSNQKLIGTSRFYEPSIDFTSIAIGFTFLEKSYWGGSTNKELKSLMISHALNNFRSVVFYIANNNIRSKKAIEKIGAHKTSEFTKSMYGKEMEYCLYTISRDDWTKIA